jgi:hypothetical protein
MDLSFWSVSFGSYFDDSFGCSKEKENRMDSNNSVVSNVDLWIPIAEVTYDDSSDAASAV